MQYCMCPPCMQATMSAGRMQLRYRAAGQAGSGSERLAAGVVFSMRLY